MVIIYLEDAVLNKGRYGLVAVNPFTKQADVRIMQKRDAKHVVPAARELIRSLGSPDMIYTDEGVEFTAKEFKSFLSDEGIQQVLSLSHATFVERFNRTLKEKLEKYKQATGTKTISTVLPKLVRNYNRTHHSAIGMAPDDVTESKKSVEDAHYSMYKKSRLRKRRAINVGDTVLVKKKRKGFEKGYWTKFLDDTHTVTNITTVGQVKYYHIRDMRRKYLRAEIQLVKGEIQESKAKPHFEGTLEARLTTRGEKLPRHRSSARIKEVRETGRPDLLPGAQKLKQKPAESTRTAKTTRRAVRRGKQGLDTANILTEGRRRR
jgi:hypothetical protein